MLTARAAYRCISQPIRSLPLRNSVHITPFVRCPSSIQPCECTRPRRQISHQYWSGVCEAMGQKDKEHLVLHCFRTRYPLNADSLNQRLRDNLPIDSTCFAVTQHPYSRNHGFSINTRGRCVAGGRGVRCFYHDQQVCNPQYSSLSSAD